MDEIWVQQLMALGLTKYEASAYLALLGHNESSAVEVAERASVPRQRVYDVLASLHEQGLTMTREARPTRHTAYEPAVALRALLETRWRQQQTENERLAKLAETIIAGLGSSSGAKPVSNGRPARPAKAHERKPRGGF